jgi:4,5-dihydroxyphthalate decarboxylase
MERPKEMSHGGSTSFNAPPGIDLTYISPSTNIGEMLEQGQLDAALVYIPDRNIVDRSRHPVDLHGAIRTLFSDPQAEGARYFGTAGILPVNHAVVIRRELLDRHPWLALNVYSAFVKAKELAFGRVVGGLGPWTSIGVIDPRLVRDMATSDPLPYGLAGQRFVLQTLELYMREQGLLHGDVGITELFAASTLDL